MPIFHQIICLLGNQSLPRGKKKDFAFLVHICHHFTYVGLCVVRHRNHAILDKLIGNSISVWWNVFIHWLGRSYIEIWSYTWIQVSLGSLANVDFNWRGFAPATSFFSNLGNRLSCQICFLSKQTNNYFIKYLIIVTLCRTNLWIMNI